VKVVICTIILLIMSNLFRRITLHLPCTVPCYAVQQIFFCCVFKGKLQPPNLSFGTKLAVKVVFCTNIVVIMSNLFRRTTVHLPCNVPCYAVQQNFFSASPRGKLQSSNLSIGTKLVVKMVFCTIIVVIMSNLFRRITLHLPCTVYS